MTHQHRYKFSHQEQSYARSTGANFDTIDVVVCEECGDVKRSTTIKKQDGV